MSINDLAISRDNNKKLEKILVDEYLEVLISNSSYSKADTYRSTRDLK